MQFPFLLFPTSHLVPDPCGCFRVVVVIDLISGSFLFLSLLPQFLHKNQGKETAKNNSYSERKMSEHWRLLGNKNAMYHASKSLGFSHTFCQHHDLLLLCGECWQLLANQVLNALEQLNIIPGKMKANPDQSCCKCFGSFLLQNRERPQHTIPNSTSLQCGKGT